MFIFGFRTNAGPVYTGLDLRQAGSFSATVSNLVVGYDGTGPAQASRQGLLALAGTNTITANSIVVGYSPTRDGGVKGQMLLGTSNGLNVANLYLGDGKANGLLTFQDGLTAPNLTLRGTSETSRANVYVGRFTSNGSGTVPTGYLMITNAGATIVASIDEMVVGALQTNASGAAPGAFGHVTVAGGTMDVNSLILGRSLPGVNTGSGSGTLSWNGGTLTVNSAFVLAQRLGGNSNVTGVATLKIGRASCRERV